MPELGWAALGRSCTNPGQRPIPALQAGWAGLLADSLCSPALGGNGVGEQWLMPTAQTSLPGWPVSGEPCCGLLWVSFPVSFIRVQSVSSPKAIEPAGEAVLRSAFWPSGPGFGGPL